LKAQPLSPTRHGSDGSALALIQKRVVAYEVHEQERTS
jgi:hypothetical protein